MRIESMESFLTIVECHSFTKAAEKLYITQPTLTRRIDELEQELNTTLIRRKRGMANIELTSAGKAFIPQAEKWIALNAETKNIMEVASRQTLSISVSNSVGSYMLNGFFDAILNSFKNEFSVRLSTNTSMDIYDNLEHGKSDIGLCCITRYSDRITATPIASEDYVLVCNKHSCHKDKDIILPNDLNPNDEVRIQWGTDMTSWHEYWFGTNSIPLVFSESRLAVSIIESNVLSWGIFPYAMAKQFESRVKICLLSNPPAPRTLYVSYIKEKIKPEHINLFTNQLIDFLSESETVNLI